MSSKYTVDTGEGYCGIVSVSVPTTTIAVQSLPVEWTDGQEIAARTLDDGVLLTPGTDGLATYQVRHPSTTGRRLDIGPQTLRALGVGEGDDLRLYEHAEGVLVVRRDDDPRVRTDGGEDRQFGRSTPDEHGSPTVMTDGGQCRWTAECRNCGKPVSTRTEGTGETEHCVRVRCSECGATNYLTERTDLGPLRADGGEHCDHHDAQVGINVEDIDGAMYTCDWCGDHATRRLIKSNRHSIRFCDECREVIKTLSRESGDVRADGGRPEGVTEHPDGFHSGTHYLDDPAPEPATDPSNCCYECGDEAHAHRCICGMPLCHRHHETQAGFCSDHTHVRTRVGDVPACIRPDHDGDLEVLVDAPGFNYERPARQRLPPSEIEQAVRSRLPDALIARAQAHLEDALALEDTEYPDKDDCQKVLHADDALAFALAADSGERTEEWLQVAYRCIDDVRESLSTDEWGLAMDLRLAAGLLEQLGADRGGDQS